MTELVARPDPHDAPGVLAAVWALGAAANIPLVAAPLYVGAYVSMYSLSEAAAGSTFSIEAGGYTVGSLLYFGLARRSLRTIALLGLLLAVAANCWTAFAPGVSMLMASRALAGLGSGLVMTVTMIAIARTQRVDRNFGLWTTIQLIVGAAYVFALPQLLGSGGVRTTFIANALIWASLLPFLRSLPADGPGREEHAVADASESAAPGVLCLAGVFVIFAGQAAIWTFCERAGARALLSADAINEAVFLSTFWAIGGGVLATLLRNRVRRGVILAAALAAQAVAIPLIFHPYGGACFSLAVGVFAGAWYICLPVASSLVADVDRSQRLVAALAAVFPASLSTGPALVAPLLDRYGLDTALWAGIGALPLGLALIWPADRWSVQQRAIATANG